MTSPEALVADPMYQLNLVLWLLQPLRDNYPMRAVLREAGLRLVGISQRMSIADPAFASRLRAAGVAHGSAKEVDVLASHKARPAYVLLECKRSMSWLQRGHDEQIEQGLSFMLQAGEQLNRALGLPINSATESWLLYVSTGIGPDDVFSGRIEALADGLAARGFAVASVGTLWLRITSDERGTRAITVQLAQRGRASPFDSPVDVDLRAGVAVQEVREDEDPRPLYYIPFDPTAFSGAEHLDDDARDNFDYCRRVFRDRILQRLVTDLGRMQIPGIVTVDPTDYLRQVLFGVFDKCERGGLANLLRRQVKVIVREVLRLAKSSYTMEDLRGRPHAFNVRIESQGARDKIIDGLSALGGDQALWRSPEDLERADPPTLFSTFDEA